jgi:hypothetical protein
MLRVCEKGHLTGRAKTCWCGKPAEGPLADRLSPTPVHELGRERRGAIKSFRAANRVGPGGTAR